MRPQIFSSLFFVATLAATALAGCSAEDSSTGQGEDDYTARGAKQGETCANGVFGTPNIPCASGLECVFAGGSNAPSGPSGSSSAKTGTCQPSGAAEGETCANGVFGTPNIPCADGLECKFPNGSSAPTGPSGSSSASTGTCEKP